MIGRFTAKRVVTPDLPAVEEPLPLAPEGVMWMGAPEAPPESLPPQQGGNPLLSDKLLDEPLMIGDRIAHEMGSRLTAQTEPTTRRRQV